jgi:type IV secretory pathway VirD2 relaxase
MISLGYPGAFVRLKIIYGGRAGVQSTARHLAYLQRPGTAQDGGRAPLFTTEGTSVNREAFCTAAKKDPFQFRLILSPERGDHPALTAYARAFMRQVETDLGTPVPWVAAAHYNTDHHHVHVVIRPRDARGQLFKISRDYLSQGLRARAAELEWSMEGGR